MPIANCQVTHPQPDFSRVFNPAIPETVTFAGTVVDLDREDMFERYDRELTSMAYTHGNTLLTLKRANKYFPVILPLLKEANVPEDLIYVACIESNMNPFAVSPAKAAGLWQFMPATGKDYGLEVNEFVDERYDIEKSTKAACRFLKQAYQRFGKWESVAASYNGGMGRISRELDAQKQKSAYDLYLTDETNRYMFRLLAMKEIMENPSKYGFEIDESQLYYPAEYDIVKVNTPVEDWAVWAVNHDTNYMTLREHNPWIRAKSLPNKTGKTYEVKIPKKNSVSRKKQNRKISVKCIQAED
ncbi:MAG: lytic transglycosylase domain-containing protein [Paramuribaculum sp.]|nr:lytic transglycosylase domain-containing protein [Paramuribaculum sp.]